MNVRFLAPKNVVKRFSDTFTGTDVGPNWVYQTVRFNANDSFTGGRLTAGNFNIVHVGGSNAGSNPAFWFPRRLTYPSGIWGASQFVQATFISATAACRHGVAVLGRWDDDSNGLARPQQAYVLVNNVGTNLEARKESTSTTDTLLGSTAELVANDVIRIEVTVTAPLNNTVVFYKNGVSFLTVVDNPSIIQAQGFPGFFAESTNLAGGSNWNNFSCGPL
jgi:hypothetical protein